MNGGFVKDEEFVLMIEAVVRRDDCLAYGYVLIRGLI